MDVVEVGDAIGRHAVVGGRQSQFRDKPALGPGKDGDNHRANSVGDRVRE